MDGGQVCNFDRLVLFNVEPIGIVAQALCWLGEAYRESQQQGSYFVVESNNDNNVPRYSLLIKLSLSTAIVVVLWSITVDEQNVSMVMFTSVKVGEENSTKTA